MKTILLSVYLLSKKSQAVFIGTRGMGGQGANPGPKYGRSRARTAAETRPGLRFRSSSRAARAALSVARCPVCLCRLQVPVSDFGPLILTNQLSKVNGYIIGL